VVPTTSFDENLTKAMIKKCKAQGVSISSALFAICNVAYVRMSPREKQELPVWVTVGSWLDQFTDAALIQDDVRAYQYPTVLPKASK
jgi:hypothetical protein